MFSFDPPENMLSDVFSVVKELGSIEKKRVDTSFLVCECNIILNSTFDPPKKG